MKTVDEKDIVTTAASTSETNVLFPVFLKLEQLNVLLVGGGNVALEKLTAILHHSPATSVRIVARAISEEIRELAFAHPAVSFVEKDFEPCDLDGQHLVVCAVNDIETSETIRTAAHAKGLLIN
ncbi:MAG TPA: NAD(P)-dependent oxidoreductase, partial [Flavisolibacter sp.]